MCLLNIHPSDIHPGPGTCHTPHIICRSAHGSMDPHYPPGLTMQGRPEAFAEYMRQYKNTICGRHPIGVLLNMRGVGGRT